jgi:lysophospholipase L1-like esterase
MVRLGRWRPAVLVSAAAVALGCCAPAAWGATAASPAFVWTPAAGYQGDPTGRGMVPETLPQQVGARDRWPMTVTVQPAWCGQGATYAFRARGRVLPSTYEGRCGFKVVFPDRGTFSVTLTVTPRGGGAPRVSGPEQVPVDGKLIVTIGDSIASGEGNPDIPGNSAQWQNTQCHRSGRSAPALAAQKLQKDYGSAAPITFVSLACSGATIADGLLGRYKGIDRERGQRYLPAQVSVLRREIVPQRTIDALVVSIGANDLFFGNVIRTCLFHPIGCFGRPVTLRDEHYPSLRDAIAEAAEELPDGYAQLAAALKGLVEPSHVLLLQYFDPTHGEDGKTCGHIGTIPRSRLDEARKDILDKLTKAGEATKTPFGWTYVSVPTEKFQKHGYCAKESWVRHLSRTTVHQGHGLNPKLSSRFAGGLHPNEVGHQMLAKKVLEPALSGKLFPVSPPPPPPADDDPGVSTGVLAAFGAADAVGLLWILRVGVARVRRRRHD